jgi:ADP-ribosyl-[dinitrogen reductase] hydrolase
VRELRRIEMVEVLHRQGLQRLRIMPSMAPSGLYWRLSVHARGCDDTDRWTSGNPDDGLDPQQLADRFVAEHPALAGAGRGEDPAYATWLSDVAELARRGWLPYFFADWETDDIEGVPLLGPEEGRPVLREPPGGR